jgi:hypothetical protein
MHCFRYQVTPTTGFSQTPFNPNPALNTRSRLISAAAN